MAVECYSLPLKLARQMATYGWALTWTAMHTRQYGYLVGYRGSALCSFRQLA